MNNKLKLIQILVIPLILSSCGRELVFRFVADPAELSSDFNLKKNIIDVGVSPSELKIRENESTNIEAKVKLKDGSVSNEVKWESSDPEIVKVDSRGNVKAVAPGEAVIKAYSLADFSRENSIAVTVLSKESAEESSPEDYNYSGSKNDYDLPASDKETYIGRNRSVFGYESPDRASYEYADSGYTSVRNISRNSYSSGNSHTDVIAVKTDKDELKLQKGNQEQIEGSVSYHSGGLDNQIKWVSSDESVAKVDSRGRVEAVSAGEATITAYSLNDFHKEKNIMVNVEDDNE